MKQLHLIVTLFSLVITSEAKPQIPEGLGDTISSLGSSAATLIRYHSLLAHLSFKGLDIKVE